MTLPRTPLLVLTFRGTRFDDHGLDLRDLGTLVSLRAIICKFAEEVWQEAHPSEPLPVRFQENIHLKLYGIEPGSVAVAIYDESLIPPGMQQLALSGKVAPTTDLRSHVKEAARRATRTVRAMALGESVTPPSGTVSHFTRLSRSIAPDDQYEIDVPGDDDAPTPTIYALPSPANDLQPATDANITPVEAPALPLAMPRVPLVLDSSARSRMASLLSSSPKEAPTRGAVGALLPTESDVVIEGDVAALTVATGDVVTVEFAHDDSMSHIETSAVRLQLSGRGVRDPKTNTLRFTSLESAKIVSDPLQQPQMDLPFEAPLEVVAARTRVVSEPPRSSAPIEATSDTTNRAQEPSWDAPCEEMFEYLAHTHPQRLLDLIRAGGLEYYDLTFAVEIAGRITDSDAVRKALLPLLSHPQPVVREGALYGLAPHRDESVNARIRYIADHDPSHGVRRAAVAMLDDDGDTHVP